VTQDGKKQTGKILCTSQLILQVCMHANIPLALLTHSIGLIKRADLVIAIIYKFMQHSEKLFNLLCMEVLV